MPTKQPTQTAQPNHLFAPHTHFSLLAPHIQRRILRDAAHPHGSFRQELRDHAFRRIILSIPPGQVSTYGAVAAAAGYPLYHRAVARLLRSDPPDSLPWHRVVGANGHIKLRDAAAVEQHARLLLEGVQFQSSSTRHPENARPENARIDMPRHACTLRPWDPDGSPDRSPD
jgi:methylated-DNA-protein-cysteine methyltransferase-like protein